MKSLHYGHCLIGVAVALIVLVALGVQASTVGFLAVVLACPLMMVVMMAAMGRDRPTAPHHDDRPVEQGRER